MIELSDTGVTIEHGETRLRWVRQEQEWILHIDGYTAEKTWVTLASETSESGYRAYLDGPVSWRERKYRIPSRVNPVIDGNRSVRWEWTQDIGGNQVHTDSIFSVDERCGIKHAVTWALGTDTIRPHFGYSVTAHQEEPIDDYAWIQSPSQAGITDKINDMTFWMVSTYDHEKGIRPFDGCQAIFSRKTSPDKLVISVKLPPGYMDFKSENLLKSGETVTVHSVLMAVRGPYYRSIGDVLTVQPLEMLPPRFSYRRHLDLVIETLRDPRKWKTEDDGIISYCVVQGNPFTHTYTIVRDREGPGWGGSWDLEMIYMFCQYKKLYADEETGVFIDNHIKKMLKGWINNPKFRMGSDVTWKQPGDMRDSFVAALMLDGPTSPMDEVDVIWICHNAYMIYYLSKITTLTGDEEYRKHAFAIAEWFFRIRHDNGSMPTLWQIDNGKAQATHDFQAGSGLMMVPALLELYSATGVARYKKAALEIADFAFEPLSDAIPHWGQGEIDWIPTDVQAIDPTGISYIIWGYADAFEATGDERYLQMVDKFCSILTGLFALWEPHEELLRGTDKITMGSHGMDLKFAGGVACGTGSYYGNLLMNRNEIGDALLRAYEVTQNNTYEAFLKAYMHWDMYFQFTRDVPEEPVSTLGSCPQNHFWTLSDPCYNNDWGCTASKNASLMMKLLERQIIHDEVQDN